ncbi:MAG: CHAT domain-containing protein [Planctomycetes bacterium]|nr:CHAT domain-containing protein [Planctomycetota bacterium]
MLALLLAIPVLAACGLPRASAPAAQGAGPDAAYESAVVALAEAARHARGSGDARAALDTFRSARQLALEAGDLPGHVVLESEIARTHEVLAEYEEQLATYVRIQTVLDAADASIPFVAAVAVRSRADASRTLLRLGRAHDAVDAAREAVRRVAATSDPESRAIGWNALGVARTAVGRRTEALACFENALRAVEGFDDGASPRADLACNLAECLGELGNHAAARVAIDTVVAAIEARRAVDPHVASRAYSVRGVLAFDRDWASAEADLRRSAHYLAARGLPEQDSRDWIAALYLAHVLRNQGRPAAAADMERKVVADLETAGGDDSLRTTAQRLLAGSLWDSAATSGDRAQLEEARELYTQVAEAERASRSAAGHLAYTPLGALLLDAFDDPRAAEPWLREAVAELEETSGRALAIDEESRAALFHHRRFQGRHDPYEGLVRCLVRLGRGEEALGVLEQSRARGLADLLERSRFDAVAEALERAEESGDEQSAARLRALPRELEAALLSAATAGRQHGDAALQRRARALERVRALSSERARLTQSVAQAAKPVDVGTLRRALGRDQALLAYLFGRRASFACLAEGAGGAVVWFELRGADGGPLSSDDVASDVSAMLAAIAGSEADAVRGVAPDPSRGADGGAAGRLWRLLVPDALWERVRGRQVLHVLPHGPLYRVPFEALVVRTAGEADGPRYWLDEGPPIAYHESGSALVWSTRQREAQQRETSLGEVLIVADPDYEASPEAVEAPTRALGVTRVQRGSRAARAGVLAGDWVRRYAGVDTATAADLERARSELSADATSVVLVVTRGSQELSLAIEAGDPGLEFQAAEAPVDLGPGAAAHPLPRLPGTAREADAVRAALEARFGGDRIRVFAGQHATETLLSAWAPRATILHIAAHQVPDALGRWQAGRISLTPPPVATVEDDGHLDLDDLLVHWRRRLVRCELVVLSSCRSRLGRLDSEEGLYALPLGFRFAGCPTVVSSLWPVDDDATATFMTAFYAGLGRPESESRLAAFTAAKRALREAHGDPRLWAPFVWTGAVR